MEFANVFSLNPGTQALYTLYFHISVQSILNKSPYVATTTTITMVYKEAKKIFSVHRLGTFIMHTPIRINMNLSILWGKLPYLCLSLI